MLGFRARGMQGRPSRSHYRRPVYVNKDAAATRLEPPLSDPKCLSNFHSGLPDYNCTPTIPLPELAAELGVKAIWVKDESTRFGLPSFKILGASWGTYRALCKKLALPCDTSLANISQAAKSHTLYACTDGNHGRAVARMARYLKISCSIYVPSTLDDHTIDKIASEDARVIVSSGPYDDAVNEAYRAASEDPNGVFVQDTAFEGYEETPAWIVEGYSAMLAESDRQLQDLNLESTLVITPVGVGSLAHAAVLHCKSKDKTKTVVTVEPDTAACLHESLKAGKMLSIKTSYTIMTGMDCGTPSYTAWPDLQKSVDASVTVSDFESHLALCELAKSGINAGPCGGAALAALRRLAASDNTQHLLTSESVVLLLSTEGQRDYMIPRDVSIDDAVNVT